MKSLRQYLRESITKIDHGWEEIYGSKGQLIGHKHTTEFKTPEMHFGHKLAVVFNQPQGKTVFKHHGVSFFVNDTGSSTLNKDVPNHIRTAMLHHVKKVVKDYVATHKPKSMSFSPYDEDDKTTDKKERLYHAGLKKMGAKRFEGRSNDTVAHFEHRLYEEVKKILDAN